MSNVKVNLYSAISRKASQLRSVL